jgi:hypothetical protein
MPPARKKRLRSVPQPNVAFWEEAEKPVGSLFIAFNKADMVLSSPPSNIKLLGRWCLTIVDTEGASCHRAQRVRRRCE